MDTLWPLMIIVFFTSAIESVVGFGAIILSIALGSRFFEIPDLIPILVPLNVVLSLGIVLKKSGFQTKISLLWLILSLLATAYLALTQRMNTYTLQFSFWLLPFVFAGLIAGLVVHKKRISRSSV